ncbi:MULTISPECIES: BglG family transcription antiterminator [Bacillaceae]|uniref:PRD domain-containing protein n=1 Tax=Evansella alkalicola TaxID=745819 RepID=A0ABS6JRL4_9BACI|nr:MULTISPECIES: PRD domain-containing protein [Bacillaceae]MBU9721208.1 PRD domain-containing protein [Bacillus alkalicola]
MKVKESYQFTKALNNNVIIAQSSDDGAEVILIGKGIGFGKKKGDRLNEFEKVFTLVDQSEQEKYKKLIGKGQEEVLLVIHEAIEKIRDILGVDLHERIHFALSQHMLLAIDRIQKGIDIQNPFLWETKWLYSKSFQAAEEVVQFIGRKMNVILPKEEVGFIALHIQSAIRDQSKNKPRETAEIISNCLSYVEEKTGYSLQKESIPYKRFVQHLKEMLERGMKDEFEIEEKVIKLLKEDSPLCYNLARNIARMIEKTVHTEIADVEVIYITIHLQRLLNE